MSPMSTAPRNRTPGADPHDPEESAIRKLLEAAAARPDELPGLSPFFSARVKAALRAPGTRQPMQLVASVAWHALPAFAALLVVLSLWAGLEIGRDAEAQEDVAMIVLQSRDIGPDAPLTTLLLAGGAEAPAQGGPR
jgi:hypothetical protein